MKSLTDMLPWRGAKESATCAPEPASGPAHAWERWARVWHAAFYVLLTLALVSSLADIGLDGKSPVAISSLTLLFGGWYWVMVMRPGWPEARWRQLTYVAVMMLLWFLLVTLHPAYHMLLFVLFAQIYSLLPIRWAIPCSVVLTALIVARGLIQQPGEAFVWISAGVLSILFGAFFGLWIDSIIRQSEERQRLIEELKSTRKELAAEERRTGMLEERGRLAREIHDTLAQGFIGIVTHLEAAEEKLPPATKPVQRHLDQALRAARENLIEARRLVAALRPEILEGSSLPEALGRLAARWSEASGVPTEVKVTGDPGQLPQELQVTLLWAAQEALSNAHKHAHASHVTLTLSFMEDLVVLDVQDDGAGFDPELAQNRSESRFGLRAMRERVEQFGGRLLVESAPGEGTTLAVQLPLETARKTTGISEESP
jgi:signal transduction histidine kinase